MTETRSVVIERELPFAPQKVWRALTEGALVREWLMENDFQPNVGHRFQFRSTPAQNWDGIIAGEVRVVEPLQRLSYSWATMGSETVVEWTLTPTATGTLLRMEHSGFRPDQEHAYKGATYGWRNFISQLEGVVANLQ